MAFEYVNADSAPGDAVTYTEALDRISSLAGRGWRLELDRMEEFALRAGLESALGLGSPRYVHIAGTNGKGTVTALTESILRAHGVRTGAFFSPYVVDPRERWQSMGAMIAPEDLADEVERLWPVAESMSATPFGGVTEFEFKTALGLAYWQRKGCEWVALEVGLGGRLDATNIVVGGVAVLVSIGLDHTAILGDTHAKIATEKAGIFKRGRPAIVGEVTEEAWDAIQAVADRVGVPVWRYGRDVHAELLSDGWAVHTPRGSVTGLRPYLAGPHVASNLSCAVAACARIGFLDEDAVRCGAESARAPGRFQVTFRNGRTWILDGAHNAESAQALARRLQTDFPGRPYRLVANLVGGHDPGAFLAAFEPVEVLVPPIDFSRTRVPTETARVAEALGRRARPQETLLDALETADQAPPTDLGVVSGSFYLVGEALRSRFFS
jgi:dihydrofolate synthase/folylpolyglutamate synthase